MDYGPISCNCCWFFACDIVLFYRGVCLIGLLYFDERKVVSVAL